MYLEYIFCLTTIWDMKLICSILAALAVAGQVQSEIVGSVDLAGETVYVWKDFGDIQVSNNKVTVHGNSRGYFMKNEAGSINPADFHQVTTSSLVW